MEILTDKDMARLKTLAIFEERREKNSSKISQLFKLSKVILQLQSSVSRKYKDKVYRKYNMNIKPEIIGHLRWKRGDLIKAEVKGNKLILEKLEDENEVKD